MALYLQKNGQQGCSDPDNQKNTPEEMTKAKELSEKYNEIFYKLNNNQKIRHSGLFFKPVDQKYMKRLKSPTYSNTFLAYYRCFIELFSD